MYIITARRITSGELLKQRKGFCIRRGYGPPLSVSSRFSLTRPIAGDTFTIADITAFVTIGFAGRIEPGIPEGCANIARWHGQIAARPSAKA